MRIVCISDTHEVHQKIVMPEGDLLIVAGDFTFKGCPNHITIFNDWLGTLDYKHKVTIAGNHDLLFEDDALQARLLLTNATYLEDSSVTIEGIKIYGSPWTPRFFDWAFNANRGPIIAAKWAAIPDDTNVLVTHGPPFGILDLTPKGLHVGCDDLLIRIDQLKQLKLHAFGHIHHSYGLAHRNGVAFANACICNEAYIAARDPIVVDI